MTESTHLIGLLLGTEQDWPTAFETIMRRLGGVSDSHDNVHNYDVERVTIEPFDLRYKPRYDLVIDRLAYWYYHPREWLKKTALMDDVYLLNSPFTFQSMEKHAAYCAMMRLGLKVPDTVLVPYKNPPEHAKYAYTAAQYNRPFDLDQVADRIGYPLFMKPYDGGAWVGVSKIDNADELHRAYDESGQRLMHLQKAVEGYDVFARSLSIGAETMVMKFDPGEPMHARYSISHGFLGEETGDEVVTIGRLVNAFFRWEFNSCETLVSGGEVYPDRLRQRLPGRGADQPALLLPVGDEGAGQVGGVLHRDRPPAALRPGHPAVFRYSRSGGSRLRRQAGQLPGAGRRAFPDRAIRRLLRQPAGPSGRGGAGLGGRPGVRSAAGRDGAERPSRHTSTTTSSPTTAACSAPG